MKTTPTALFLFLAANTSFSFQQHASFQRNTFRLQATESDNNDSETTNGFSRRDLLATIGSTAITATSMGGILTSGGSLMPSEGGVFRPQPAQAIGPVKINLLNPTYTAIPCPKDKPIPGEKAMKGMRGLCVTVNVDLEELPDRELDKIGVYGYITDKGTGESVLANNPDLSTDAGQFAMIEKIQKTDKKTQFEFIAAVPKEMDLTPFDEGIAPLTFKSLRVVSFPGGQQYGSINPCEMNEFSDECAVWEDENGPYKKGDFMVKSNERTKGR